MPRHFSWVLAALGLGLSGCANFSQQAHEVLVRDPAKRRYEDPVAARLHARNQWQYAAMSDYAYEVARQRAGVQTASDASGSQDAPVACGTLDRPPIPREWERWQEFPSRKLTEAMRRKGLFLMVLERHSAPREIVVVFEGTNFFEIPDWVSNLRWFLLRFVPNFEDQYTMTARQVAEEFHARIRSKPMDYVLDPNVDALHHPGGEVIRIVSTGHSLGAGLAQHFAYTFKQEPASAKGPRVSEVFAFDPSPVTGWTTAPDPPRTHNANGLRINRIFEHGEVLAYVRLFTSRLSAYTEHPSIWEYRYNFDPRANIIRNHSMRSLACGLYRAVHDEPG